MGFHRAAGDLVLVSVTASICGATLLSMPDMLTADLAAIAAEYADLATALQGIDGLSGVLEWGKREGLPVAEIEIVTMDEYTHDAILAWRDKYLVFGAT